MPVGTEWIIDAFACDAAKLRDETILREIFKRIIDELSLTVIKEVWHQFPAAYGVTGFALLSESHLACHTYPEYKTATFNLYCCRQRPAWNWEENFKTMLGAGEVKITKIERGLPQSENENPQIQIAGGER